MLAHTKVCTKMPQNDPTQTALSFAGGEGGGLVAASQRFNLAACRKAIALFVILDEHAFRVVEGEGFKLLCKQLQPQLTIPSRRTVARDCFQLFVDEKARLKGYFKSDCNRVALTTDAKLAKDFQAVLKELIQKACLLICKFSGWCKRFVK